MKISDLLLEEDRCKWFILQYLSLRRNGFITIDMLCDFFDLSKYKVEKYLEDLITDTIEITGRQVFFLTDSGEIQCDGLTPLLIKQFTGKFFLSSEVFQIFHGTLVWEERPENQMENYALSRSTTFKIRGRLKRDLESEGIDYKKNSFSGDEFKLRSFLFSMYYEAFNGIENPFPVEIQNQRKKVILHILQLRQVSLKKSQEHRLNLFIDIWLVRLKNRHYLDRIYGEACPQELLNMIGRKIQKHYFVPDEVLRQELDYFFLFLELEGILPGDEITYYDTKENSKAQILTGEFLVYFTECFKLEPEELLLNKEAQRDLLTIHRKLLFYHFREITFINGTNTKFFEEVNPVIDRSITSFLNRKEVRSVLLSQEEWNKLYHDYLFYVLYWLPASKLETPLYVCIDFSHGKYYNKYVQEMLNSMQSMNIQFEDKLSAQTSIYLADLAIEKLPCTQVIWKRPPTPDDWREIGDLLVKIKEGKVDEKNSRTQSDTVVSIRFNKSTNRESDPLNSK